MCSYCGRYIQKHSYSYQARRVDPLKVRQLVQFLRMGYTVHHASRKANVNYIFAQDYAHRLLDNLGEELNCSCGLPRSHNGYCAWRIANDPIWAGMAKKKTDKILAQAEEVELRRELRLQESNRRAQANSHPLGVVWRPDKDVVLIRGTRCKEKGCPFGAADEISQLCAYHERYFDYSESLIDSAIGFRDISHSWDYEVENKSALSVVGVRDVKGLTKFVVQDRHGTFSVEYEKDTFVGLAHAQT